MSDRQTTIRLVDTDTGETVGVAARVSPPFRHTYLQKAALVAMAADPALAGYALIHVYHDHDTGYVAEIIREDGR